MQSKYVAHEREFIYEPSYDAKTTNRQSVSMEFYHSQFANRKKNPKTETDRPTTSNSYDNECYNKFAQMVDVTYGLFGMANMNECACVRPLLR